MRHFLLRFRRGKLLFFFLLTFASMPHFHAHAFDAASFVQTPSVAAASDVVYFNVKTLKFHRMDCVWALRCTVNCIAVSRAEAVRRGGVLGALPSPRSRGEG